ncbi:hypothetical protein R5R35_012362 [Gryllus longicercus]|uniref:AAA+ ATPase domain-containing protein n=1 Tax=Gryllus longicercus TaxID=2509291 RepID=A0AAN9VNH8_9ORTH
MSHSLGPSSSVHYVLLTGKPGIGKSTLVKKVCEELTKKGINVRGFYTEEVRKSNGGGRIGFDVVTLSGARAALARVSDTNAGRQPRVGKYSVNVKLFEDIAMPVLQEAHSANSVLIIDEIGKMEMLSEMFCREVKSIFTKPQAILATVPIGNNSLVKTIQSLPSAQTFEVDYTNRNSLLNPVVEILLQSVKRC